MTLSFLLNFPSSFSKTHKHHKSRQRSRSLMGGAPWCWAAPVTAFPQSTATHGTGRVRARKRMNWCPSIQTTQCTQTSQESTTASQKMKKIKVCLIPSICLNVSEFQGLITVCVIAQETSGKFISDHVFRLSVHTSHVLRPSHKHTSRIKE